MLHWALVVGGLLIVVDLGTVALGSGTAAPDTVDAQLLQMVDLAANFALEIFVGVRVFRATGSLPKAALAGLLASLLDGGFNAAATLWNPTAFGGIPAGMTPLDVIANTVGQNVVEGTLMAIGGALTSGFARSRKRS